MQSTNSPGERAFRLGRIEAERFDPEPLRAFRALYPTGGNFVVTPHTKSPYHRRLKDMPITVCGIDDVPG